jgi:GH43 family beta-xylosidase
MWAPELHRVEGQWYIYYTAGQNTTDYVLTQRVWVLEGGTEGPLSGEYTFAGQITPPNYDQGMLDAERSAGEVD